MSYYSEMNKAKTRIRTAWLPKVSAGETIQIMDILYDLDNLHLEYGERAIIKYITRACIIEGYDFDGEIIKK